MHAATHNEIHMYMYITVIEAARTVRGLEEIWYGCSSNRSGCSLLF